MSAEMHDVLRCCHFPGISGGSGMPAVVLQLKHTATTEPAYFILSLPPAQHATA